MGAAEHRFRERLNMRSAEFNYGTYVVSEKVSGDWSATGKISGGAAVSLEFGFDPNQVGQKIGECAAAAVERKGAESRNVVVLGIEAHVRIVPGNFHFGAILREGCRSKQQKKPK
jgi:ABC-type sugar transport system substrate-binding protein